MTTRLTPRIALLLALAMTACGGSSDDGEPTERAAPAAAPAPAPPSLEQQTYTDADPLTVDGEAAKHLPADTSGAFSIADLPKLAARLGLGVTSDDMVKALRGELTDLLGLDLLDADAARAAGVAPDQPITLAWLDTEARYLALVVTVDDSAKLEAALKGRPLLIRQQRALIPLGEAARQTEHRLEQVTPTSSLASSGALDRAGTVGFGTDAALYMKVDIWAGLLGAQTIAGGFTVRDDGVRSKLIASFADDVPDSGRFVHSAGRELGAEFTEDQPSFGHQLLRELEQQSTDVLSGFVLDKVIENLLGTRASEALGAKAGVVALAGRKDGQRLIYYGGIAFNGALVAELFGASAQLVADARAERKRLDDDAMIARNAGILGALNDQPGAFASLTGTADFTSGLDDANVFGGLIGDDIDEMQGGFGLSSGGVGAGGGGTGWGTIGTGKYGTIGHGGGTGSGYGTGSGRGGMRGRKSPSARIGKATVSGSLDKNIIRRYIRRKLPRVKYCYEKQLILDEDLAGTVKVSFTIATSGRVSAASASGMRPEVADCVAKAVREIRFPKPNGGEVTVVYPFTFKPGS